MDDTTAAPLPRQSVTWMRISDAVAAGTGRVAGQGLRFETAMARRIRRFSAVTRRAIRERTHHLAPVSAFGHSPSIDRDGLRRG